MFGNMMEIMGKLQGLKDKFSELKTRLDNTEFTESSNDGTVRITLTEFGTIKDIQVASGLLADREALEDQLVVTMNKALDKVKHNLEEQAKQTAKENLPSIPGLSI